MKVYVVLFAAFSCCAEAALLNFSASFLQGRWFQVFSSLVPKESFQANGFCNTVDFYNLKLSDNTASFNVTYSQNVGSPDGTIQETHAILYASDINNYPGRFRNVYTQALLQVETAVLVKAVGAAEEGQSEYPWVILSSPNKIFAYILCRDIQTFAIKYQDEVLSQARLLGFNKALTEPIGTAHSDSCSYSHPPFANASA